MASAKRIGYAVVGLGSISQVAVLPAFAHSKKAKLVAVVSGDKKKAQKFAQDFHASQACIYDELSQCLENPQVDAVYIATPPGEHEKYAVAAAKAGKHVISEKPLAFRSAALVSPTGLSGKTRDGGDPNGTRAMPWLHAIFERPLWSQGLWNALASRRSIRFFLRKTWGSDNYDEGLAEYDYLTTHQPGAQHAPYYFVSGYLFSTAIMKIYMTLTLPVWMTHGVRGDFTDYRNKAKLQDRDTWRIDVMDSGAMPHFEQREQFIAMYDEFLAGVASPVQV